MNNNNVIIIFLLLALAVAVFGQEKSSNFANIDAINFFGGIDIAKSDFDYVRLHMDFSSHNFITAQFRYDFMLEQLQLANITRTFGKIRVTVGRFLDPVWYLYPAPHLMPQVFYPLTTLSLLVFENGVGIKYQDKDLSLRVSGYDFGGRASISFSAEMNQICLFLQKRNKNIIGFVLRKKFNSILNLEGGGVVSSSDSELFGFYLQNQLTINNLIIMFQADLMHDKRRMLAGLSYKYSEGSHLKFVYNFTQKTLVAKISFFM